MDNLFQPLPKVSLPPVIHSQFVPNKPRGDAIRPPARLDSHIESFTRQHSYTTTDYELQRRVRINERAHSQLLENNPEIRDYLSPQLPLPCSTDPAQNGSSLDLPTGSTTINPTTATTSTVHPSSFPTKRVPFGESLQASSNFSSSDNPASYFSRPVLTSALERNLFHDSVSSSSSDSFIIVEDSAQPKAGVTSINARSSLQSHPFATTQQSASTALHPQQQQPQQQQQQQQPPPSSASRAPTFSLQNPTNRSAPVGSERSELLCSNSVQTSHGIDLRFVEPKHEACLMTVDVTRHMQLGTKAIKYGRRGKPHTTDILLSKNCRYFSWDSKKHSSESVVRFSWITGVTQGQKTPVFKRYLDKRIESLSLTVFYSRPERYMHVDDSDDEVVTTGGEDDLTTNINDFMADSSFRNSINNTNSQLRQSRNSYVMFDSSMFNRNSFLTLNNNNNNNNNNNTPEIGSSSQQQQQQQQQSAASRSSASGGGLLSGLFGRTNQSQTTSQQQQASSSSSSTTATNKQQTKTSIRRSTWRGTWEDLTVDLVFEDPNDFLIWYHGLRTLTDMSSNKLSLHDPSLRLTRLTTLQLTLPICSNYPSSRYILDSITALSVAEQCENEQQHELNQLSAQIALSQKESLKNFIRRTTTTSSLGNGADLSAYHANGDGGNADNVSQRPEQNEIDAAEEEEEESAEAFLGIAPTHTQLITATAPISTSSQSNNGVNNHSFPTTAPAAAAAAAALSTTSKRSRTGSSSSSSSCMYPNGSAIPIIPSSFLAFPTPWTAITLRGQSDIVDLSWLQQIIHNGPSLVHTAPWVCAYSLSRHAATFDRLLDRAKLAQQEAIPGLAAAFRRDTGPAMSTFGTAAFGITSDTPAPNLSAPEPQLTSQELSRAVRIYDNFMHKAGQHSVLILRTRSGDVFGGFAAESWTKKAGFYGTPDSFVFRVGHDRVLSQQEAAAVAAAAAESNDNPDEPTDPNSSMSVQSSTAATSCSAVTTASSILVNGDILQLHVFRWSGDASARLFQFSSYDAFGFGSNNIEVKTNKPDDAASSATSSTAASDLRPFSQPMPAGPSPFVKAGADTGPAIALDMALARGASSPCPVYHSPLLSQQKLFECMQLELWVPVPRWPQ